jgi:phosphoribosylaminoimidazole-succinocarboxamide synthase
MSSTPLISTTDLLPPTLPLLASGKVRDLYLDADTLLFVATDRISAWDAVLANGIPCKGRLLTLLTTHWIRLINERLPSIKTHFISLNLPSFIPSSSRSVLQDRTMIVRKCRVLPLECIVRGYLTGSALAEYQRSRTIHGIPLPPGLRQCEALPGGALFTPSTVRNTASCRSS